MLTYIGLKFLGLLTSVTLITSYCRAGDAQQNSLFYNKNAKLEIDN